MPLKTLYSYTNERKFCLHSHFSQTRILDTHSTMRPCNNNNRTQSLSDRNLSIMHCVIINDILNTFQSRIIEERASPTNDQTVFPTFRPEFCSNLYLEKLFNDGHFQLADTFFPMIYLEFGYCNCCFTRKSG